MVSSAARRGLLVLAALLLVVPGADAVRVLDSPDRLPDRVHAYGSAQLEDEAYLVGGGRGPAYIDEITLVRADGSTSTVAHLPQGLKSPAVAAAGGDVYIFGGAQRSTQDELPQTTDAIHRFDPETGKVEEVIDASLPEPIAAASAVTVDGTIYLLGGLSIQPNGDPQIDFKRSVLAFDPDQGSVTRLDAQLPTGRAQASAVAHGDDVLYLGGHAEASETTCDGGHSTCFVTDVLRLDPDRETVGQIGDLAQPVRWSAAAFHDGTAFVLGGCTANCDAHRGASAIQAVNASTGQTRELPVTMPLTGGRNDALLHGDTAWIPGGVRASDNGTQDHDRILRVDLGDTRPWAPIELTAESVPGGVKLDWQPPSYDGGQPVQSYVVERARGAREPTRLDQVTDTQFRDRNASQGVSYTYRVRAENTQGLSAPSGEVLVRPTETPDPPAVTAQGGDGKLVVQWTPPENTGGLDVTAYRVFAYTPGSDADLERCASACWGTVGNQTTRVTIDTVQDEPVANGETYEVRVQARNANGWSAASEPREAEAKPVPDAPTALETQASGEGDTRSVELNWTSPEADVDGYTVYRGPALDELTQIGSASEPSFTDKGDVPEGHRVLYAVAARADGAESPLSQPSDVVFATPPGEVTDLTARWTGSHVAVAWAAPNETGGHPIVRYEVARTEGAMDPEAAEAEIHRTAVERYQDESPPRGTPVAYHVRAVTEAGEGDWDFEQVRVPLTQDSRPPVPVLAAHPTKVDVGERVVFDASGSQDDGAIVAYNFSFGDGEATGWRSSPRVTYTYDQAGVYNATVTVRDADGLQAESKATIAVGPPPEPDPNDTVGGDAGEKIGSTDDTPLPATAAIVSLAAAVLVAGRRR